MVRTQGTGDFTEDVVTVGGTATAPSGTFSDSLTISGVPVLTGTPSTPPVLVDKFIRYTGTGVNPNVIELTGINRLHQLTLIRANADLNKVPQLAMPQGETGPMITRNTNKQAGFGGLSVDAPNPGVSQLLSINTVSVALNEDGKPYRLHINGEPV